MHEAREEENDAELISGISSRLEHLLQQPRVLRQQLEAAIEREEVSYSYSYQHTHSRALRDSTYSCSVGR